tara:strand:- start:9 stop:659 length:651 start_codon:yes stop_codon:yes gene_type:complete
MGLLTRVNDSSCNAVSKVEPSQLKELILNRIDQKPSIFGLITTIIANENAESSDELNQSIDEKAAGVQLIYEGLKLTQELVRDEGWKHEENKLQADLELLAADVMVSRGFNLLSHTPAAKKAVETIRSFGQTESIFSNGLEKNSSSEESLEKDLFELSIITGFYLLNKKPPKDIGIPHLLHFNISNQEIEHLKDLDKILNNTEQNESLILTIAAER